MTRESRLSSTNLGSNQRKKNLLTLSGLWRNPVHKLPRVKKKILGLPVQRKFFDPKFQSKCWGLMLSRDWGGAPWRRFNLIKTQRVAIYCLPPPPWPLTCVPENSFNCHPSSSGSLVVYNPGTSGIVKCDKVQASKKLEKAKFSQSPRSLEISYRSSVSSHRRPLHLSLHCLAL